MSHKNFQQWLEKRKNTIGASDISTVLGMNKYSTPSQLLAEKCGSYNKANFQTEATLRGHFSESIIEDYWKFGHIFESGKIDPDLTFRNKLDKKIQRTCKKCKSKTYKGFLSATPDRVIIQDSRYSNLKGLLEFKTITKFAGDSFIEGVPVGYVFQCQAQMLVFGADYVELCIWQDGINFQIFYIARNEQLIKKMLEKISNFWVLVQTGLKLRKEIEGAKIDSDERGLLEWDYEQLLNIGDQEFYSNSFDQYLDTVFNDDGLFVASTDFPNSDKILSLLKEEKKLSEEIKTLTSVKEAKKREIKYLMGDISGIDFAEEGRVTNKANKNGSKLLKNLINI
jgi:hypothetical protein